MYGYTPDIVASFSIPQLKRYKSYAYKWEYINSRGIGLNPSEYDKMFETESVSRKNRKNTHKEADKMIPAIAELNKQGIMNPNIRQINEKIYEMDSRTKKR